MRKKKELWIVATDEPYYPTVDVFGDEGKARKEYAESGGDIVYLAKVVGKKEAKKGNVGKALRKENVNGNKR